MQSVDIIRVSADDYEAIYIDNKQSIAGHSIDISVLITELLEGKYINSYKNYWIDDYILEEKYDWNFPSTFTEWDINDLK